MIENRYQQLDEQEMRLKNMAEQNLNRSEAFLERLATALNVLNPHKVLERGYAFVTDTENKVISTSMLPGDKKLQLHFADGTLPVRVDRPDELF